LIIHSAGDLGGKDDGSGPEKFGLDRALSCAGGDLQQKVDLAIVFS
jgi:hypothetical protein